MATIKAYTDIEQSRKLAEILPFDSADMYWSRCTITDFGDDVLKVSYSVEPCNISQFRNTKEDIPCWSLAALFEALPKNYGRYTKSLNWFDDACHCDYIDEDSEVMDVGTSADNPIDACYEIVLKLNEMKML